MSTSISCETDKESHVPTVKIKFTYQLLQRSLCAITNTDFLALHLFHRLEMHLKLKSIFRFAAGEL